MTDTHRAIGITRPAGAGWPSGIEGLRVALRHEPNDGEGKNGIVAVFHIGDQIVEHTLVTSIEHAAHLFAEILHLGAIDRDDLAKLGLEED